MPVSLCMPALRLGKHNRKVLPACVVSTIRKHYPEENDDYTGYVDLREVQNALDFDSD